VKINYSVDIEEIPDKIQEMLKSVATNLEYLSDSIPFEIKLDKTSESVSLFANQIDKIRQKLFILDSQLEDTVSITSEWYQTVMAVEIKKLGLDTKNEEIEDVESD
jgi:CII-binding regulator of phage lambda lysogenization HflD